MSEETKTGTSEQVTLGALLAQLLNAEQRIADLEKRLAAFGIA